MKRFSLIGYMILCAALAGCQAEQDRVPPATVSTVADEEPPKLVAEDFSYGYWLNGWRKPADDTSADVLRIETNKYTFEYDLDRLEEPSFGLFDRAVGYLASLDTGEERLESLEPAALTVAIKVAGKSYRAVSSPKNQALMWESGKLAQHFEFRSLRFEDETGELLPAFGALRLVAWPDSLTFSAEFMPDLIYADGESEGVVGSGLCIVKKPLVIPHSPKLEPEKLTVECWLKIPEKMDSSRFGWLLCKNRNENQIGNYGFTLRSGATAVMNNLGGRDNQHHLKQRGNLVKGKWHHLALTYDGRKMVFYVNGQLQDSKTLNEKRRVGTGSLRLGQRADGRSGVTGGLYDQVRVWNRALSGAEIRAHAQRPKVLRNSKGLVLNQDFETGIKFEPTVWNDVTLRLDFTLPGGRRQDEAFISGPWRMGEKKSLHIRCPVESEAQSGKSKLQIGVSTPGGQQFPVQFNDVLGCHVASVKNLKRRFAGKYVKITDYDVFDIVVDSVRERTEKVPFLLDFHGPANITGLVPILCQADGTPTGIHMQVSKNWHKSGFGNYLRAYALLPVEPGANQYQLRIPYGFYGSLPSASHGQLSLVGYGGNQRWDQLALACGGELITFDLDMSLTEVAVCDVRVALGRKGKNGNAWDWSDAGWGGDWLGLFAGKTKLAFSEMKTAYLSHGPCLTDVVYKGAYGTDRSVLVDARVQLSRTDDYGRTFQTLQYHFEQPNSAKESYFLKRHGRAFDGTVAYGNAAGLIAEKRVTSTLRKGDLLVASVELSGPGPWWVAFPERGAETTGYVSLIIREYAASFGDRTSTNPSLRVRVQEIRKDQAKLEALIVPPKGVETFKPGDFVILDSEWVHLVTEADNYGGPNELYRQHLQENPRSWKTTHREAVGNDLQIAVRGGDLLQELPVVIRAELPEVTVDIKGGVGFLPIRFENLATADGYAIYEVVSGMEVKLDQAVHGNDFWQTDYDGATDSYKLSFNLPVDGKSTSTWILKTSLL